MYFLCLGTRYNHTCVSKLERIKSDTGVGAFVIVRVFDVYLVLDTLSTQVCAIAYSGIIDIDGEVSCVLFECGRYIVFD
jgi:hypothetical protein